LISKGWCPNSLVRAFRFDVIADPNNSHAPRVCLVADSTFRPRLPQAWCGGLPLVNVGGANLSALN
jgi:hypothetical protein